MKLAGDAVREVYLRGTYEKTLKKDHSFLTEADRASNNILCEGLSKIAPGIPILSEESEDVPYEVRKEWEYYFLIDPVDGTREFVAGIPEFAVNVALIHNGKPVLGLVHSPLSMITYAASRGRGAYKIEEKCQRLPLSNGEFGRVRVLLSQTDHSPGLSALISGIPNADVSRLGSSLKFCAVAEGIADFYPRLKPSMEWDTAAGAILVEESGGLICEPSGAVIDYNRPNMLNPPFYALGKFLFEKMPDWKALLIKKGEKF